MTTLVDRYFAVLQRVGVDDFEHPELEAPPPANERRGLACGARAAGRGGRSNHAGS